MNELEKALLAIELFLEGGISAADAREAAEPPESSLRHDGETWVNGEAQEDG